MSPITSQRLHLVKSAPTFAVYLARTGERQDINAENWGAALKATGRPDACLIAPQADGAIDVTFNPTSPTIVTTRCNEDDAAERLAFALACVVEHLASEVPSISGTIHSGGWVSAMDLASDHRRRQEALRQCKKEGLT